MSRALPRFPRGGEAVVIRSNSETILEVLDDRGHGQIGSLSTHAPLTLPGMAATRFPARSSASVLKRVVLFALPSGLRFEDDPKARAGRLSEALQRIGRGSYFATFDTRDVGL